MALCWKLQPFVSCERLEVLVSTFQYTLLQGLLSDVPVLHLVPVHCKGLNMQLVRFGSLLLQHLSMSDNLFKRDAVELVSDQEAGKGDLCGESSCSGGYLCHARRSGSVAV